MRVVLGSNILIRAAVSKAGPARELLLLLRPKRHCLVTSVIILGEVERVLTYPRLQGRWPLTAGESSHLSARRPS